MKSFMVMATCIFIMLASTFTVTLTSMPAEMVQWWWTRVAGLDDRLFVDNTLFDLAAFSTDCVSRCSRTVGCFTVTLYFGGRCRGHDAAMTTRWANTPSAGARTYITLKDEWQGANCAIDEECPRDLNAKCFAGVCTCMPGYFYSTSARVCQAVCPMEALGTSFLKYPQHRIFENNLVTLSNQTLALCQNQCLGYWEFSGAVCRSMEYLNNRNPECNLASVTPLDQPLEAVPTYDYYQRVCS